MRTRSAILASLASGAILLIGMAGREPADHSHRCAGAVLGSARRSTHSPCTHNLGRPRGTFRGQSRELHRQPDPDTLWNHPGEGRDFWWEDHERGSPADDRRRFDIDRNRPAGGTDAPIRSSLQPIRPGRYDQRRDVHQPGLPDLAAGGSGCSTLHGVARDPATTPLGRARQFPRLRDDGHHRQHALQHRRPS